MTELHRIIQQFLFPPLMGMLIVRNVINRAKAKEFLNEFLDEAVIHVCEDDTALNEAFKREDALVINEAIHTLLSDKIYRESGINVLDVMKDEGLIIRLFKGHQLKMFDSEARMSKSVNLSRVTQSLDFKFH